MSTVLAALKEALKAYNANEYTLAETIIAEVLEADPQNLDGLILGANIAYDSGHFALAYPRVMAAINRSPNSAELYNLLGLILAGTHRALGAEAAYRKALECDNAYDPARQNLAFHLLNTAQPDNAIVEFDRFLAKNPNHEKVCLGRIYALQACERGEEALTALNLLSGADTAHERAALRGQILFGLGRYPEAIEANNQAIGARKHGPLALANTAQTLHMLGQWDSADVFLSSMVDGPSARADLSAAAAKSYLRAGEYSKAREVLSAARKKFGDKPDLLWVSAELSRLMDDPETAYQDALAALKGRPGTPQFMAEFAQSALVSGHIEECMTVCELALKSNPNDQFWIAMLATGGRLKGQNYRYYFDYPKFLRVYDLTPPKGYMGMDAFNAALKKVLNNLHGFTSAPLDQSLRLGTQTTPDLRFVDDPVIQDFFKMIDAPIRDYMDAIGQDPGHPLTKRNTGAYRIASAWSVRLGAGGHHVNHVHPEGWISSSYYVDVPSEVTNAETKAGWIKFGAPPLNMETLTDEEFVQPKPGRLALFPSYLWHGTVPIQSGEPRLTLPFDVVPA